MLSSELALPLLIGCALFLGLLGLIGRFVDQSVDDNVNGMKKMFSKPLIITLLVSISLNCLFGYLSYSFYSDKAVAESQLEVAIVSNKFMALSLERKDKVCTLQDKIATEDQTEQRDCREN